MSLKIKIIYRKFTSFSKVNIQGLADEYYESDINS
jgi:hypothetical protein